MGGPITDLIPDSRGVTDFYAKRNILITGATGFLGKLLTEKILRVCPNINNLFLILRAKKAKSSETRLRELFDDVVFDQLRKENPEFAGKVVLIEGDMEQIGLGLSPEHRELLRTTHIVLHGAASVKFNEPIRQAARINVRGTKELVSLAMEMPDLKAFVHISTAYSNCVHELIEEKFYPPPMDAQKLLNLTEILDDTALDHLTPVLLGKWPNTYAYTKAIAEDTIRQNCGHLPLCIVRPSIVLSTYKEPVPGWIASANGAIRPIFDISLGVIHSMYCDENLITDSIPADYVINSVIVTAWNVDRTRNTNRNDESTSAVAEDKESPIYNIVSSCQNPITWKQLMGHVEETVKQIPSVLCLWYYFLINNKHYWFYKLYMILLHFMPAAIFDIVTWSVGQKPIMCRAYKKVHKYILVLSYFTTTQWRFRNDRTMRMWESLSSADRAKYEFNTANLDWADYLHSLVRGMRVYLLKDPLDTLPEGRAKYAKLKVAHYTVVTTLCAFLGWILWIFLRFLTSW